MSEEELLRELTNSVVQGDEEGSRRLAKAVVEKGIAPFKATERALVQGMQIVADKWDKGEFYLSDAMLAAEAMKAAMDILLQDVKPEERLKMAAGKVVLGTVFGDIHDIGKDIVGTMLTAHGFVVYDIGVDAHPSKFIEKAEEVDADIIAMSCLISPSMFYQRDVIRDLDAMGKRNKYYIIVGGAASNCDWAKEIRVDGYARYAKDAPELCKELVKSSPPPLAEPICIG